jgi:hypothetical protein
MLGLQRFREVEPTLSDSQLEALRAVLYGLAELVTSAFVEKTHQASNTESLIGVPGCSENFAALLSAIPEAEKHELEERAAIMQFDGKLSRSQAEQSAVESYWAGKRSNGLKQ